MCRVPFQISEAAPEPNPGGGGQWGLHPAFSPTESTPLGP